MYQFTCILFHMDLMDPYEFLLALYFDLYLSVSADWVVQLRDLIVLWVIRIEIILTVKFTVLCDRTVGCKTDSNCFFYYPFIQYRKGTRHTGTDRTCMCIRCTTKCGTAAAEYLRLCRKLYMNLQTDHGFVYFTHLTDPFLLQRQAACTLLSAQMHMPPE